MTTAYAIGDIHGQLGLLEAAHERIEADRARYGAAEAPVVHLGDLVDRGPESAGVIAYLRRHHAAGAHWITLRGNHDRMFEGFLADPALRDPGLRSEYSWLHPRIGGAETLASYGVRAAGDRPVKPVHAEALARVPEGDRRFLAGLAPYYLIDDLLFTHAGIRPAVPLAAQSDTDLCWIRSPFLTHLEPHPWLVIHGHTVVERPEHHGNRVAIDTGAAYGGPLTAIVLEGRDIFVLGPDGRSPLRPD